MTVNAIEDDITALEETVAELELLEVRVAPGAPVANKTLEDISLPTDALVVSNVTEAVIASGGTRLLPGETYVIAVRPSVVEDVTRLFRG